MKRNCESCGKEFEAANQGKLCPDCVQEVPLQTFDYDNLWRQAKYTEDNSDSER